eukprot:snap_masked-scaffold_6-processed-gene-14.25-mRNA-1 protein AED:1.00 eAED:1.00 QI:0/0/0/0/1/1/2/0/64
MSVLRVVQKTYSCVHIKCRKDKIRFKSACKGLSIFQRENDVKISFAISLERTFIDKSETEQCYF